MKPVLAISRSMMAIARSSMLFGLGLKLGGVLLGEGLNLELVGVASLGVDLLHLADLGCHLLSLAEGVLDHLLSALALGFLVGVGLLLALVHLVGSLVLHLAKLLVEMFS